MQIVRRKFWIVLLITVLITVASLPAEAQCSVCTRTVQQMGEKPARGLNAGIMYLAFAPLLLIGSIGYIWWRKNRRTQV